MIDIIRVMIADILHFHKLFQGVPTTDFKFDIHSAECLLHPPEFPHVVLQHTDGRYLRIEFSKTTNLSSTMMFYLAVSLRGVFHDWCMNADIWDVSKKPIDPEKKWWSIGEELVREVDAARKAKREELLVHVPGTPKFPEARMKHFANRWEKLHFHRFGGLNEEDALVSPPVFMHLLGELISIYGHEKAILFIPVSGNAVYTMASRGSAKMEEKIEDVDQVFADMSLLCAMRCGTVMRHREGPLWTYVAYYKDNVVFGHAFHKDPEVVFKIGTFAKREDAMSESSYTASIEILAEIQEENKQEKQAIRSRFMDC